MAFFSDWGAASEYEDIDAAQAQLATWMASAVTNNGWPAEAAAAVVAGGQEVLDSLETWFGYDVGTAADYWSQVATWADYWVTEAGFSTAALDNWTSWVDTFQSAVDSSATTEDAREAGEVSTVVSGTAAATVTDLTTGTGAAIAKGAAVGALVGGGGMFIVDKKQTVIGAWTGAALGGLFAAWRSLPDAQA
jgi:hypothetical protein